MVAYTPTTLDQLIYDTIAMEMSDLTVSMLVDTVLDFERNNQPLEEIVDQIALVLANQPHTLGDEFKARVQEAFSFTREDGGSIFDCDHER